MAEMFSGDWTVEVFQKDAAFSQRFIIEDSLASDGVYPGETATPTVSVSGPTWFIRFEWNDNAGSGWQPSDVRRTGATYTLQDGLVVLLGADDNFEQLRDHDFNDVVLRCRNIAPHLNPWRPFANPYDFTLPPDDRRRDPRGDRPRGPRDDRPRDPRDDIRRGPEG